MAVKWFLKACASIVLAIILVLYPEKAIALGTLVAQTLWNVAIMIGENLDIPGEDRAKASAALVPLLLPGRFGRPADAFKPSDQKDITLS